DMTGGTGTIAATQGKQFVEASIADILHQAGAVLGVDFVLHALAVDDGDGRHRGWCPCGNGFVWVAMTTRHVQVKAGVVGSRLSVSQGSRSLLSPRAKQPATPGTGRPKR